VLLATHSPVLASFPGATVYELDGDGFAPRDGADLDLVRDWEAFFDDPGRMHHHLLHD
jgi:predicted ATPase